MKVKKSKTKSKGLGKKQKIILCSVSLLVISVFLTLGLTVWSAGPINGSNVRISYSNLGSLNYEIGAREIIGYQDLGCIELDNDTMQCKARVTARVESNFFTDLLTEESYNSVKKTTKNVKYVTIETCTSPSSEKTYNGEKNYYAHYETYEFGDISEEAKGFNGIVNMEASLIDMTSETVKQTGVKVVSGDFTSYTRKIVVVDSYYEEIGQYSDYYSKGMTEQTVGISSFSTDGNSMTSSHDKWQSLPTLGLYHQSIDDENTELGQYAVVQTPTVGQDYVAENGFHLKIVPGITVATQTLKFVHSDYILVDNQKDWWDTRFGYIPDKSDNTEIDTIDRVVSWHVTNYMVQVAFEIEFDVESIVEIEIDDSEAYDLESVKLFVEDHYWDTQLGGTSVDIPVQDKSLTELWLEQNWITLLIVGVIALGIAITVIYLKFGGGLSALGSSKQKRNVNISIGNKTNRVSKSK